LGQAPPTHNRKIKNKKWIDNLNIEQTKRIIEALFITNKHKETNGRVLMGSCDNGEGTDDSATIHMDELSKAMDRLNPEKAADIDEVPGKIIRLLFEHRPHDRLEAINNI
jgi:hypothetical protein